ncbi:MAG: hypothetical protein HQK66_07630 [Desulfamplus sp.]|nr:hypothetical protein [Desulfamplus sp.]
MLDPATTAETIIKFMIRQLRETRNDEIIINVSHDWNIFPIKEFTLDMPHEEAGMVGYLESVVLFEDKGRYMVASYQKSPEELPYH